jgi:hypothetical protein
MTRVFNQDFHHSKFQGKLVGVNVTDGVVNHFRQYHSESDSYIDNLASSWDMLSKKL